MPRSISPDFEMYFGPRSIWAVDMKREPGHWVITKPNREITEFHGPFDNEEEAQLYMREEWCPTCGFTDTRKTITIHRCENILPAPMPPSIGPLDTLASQVNGERQPIHRIIKRFASATVEHGSGHSVSTEMEATRTLVHQVITSLLLNHPREDMRIVLQETLDELEGKQSTKVLKPGENNVN